jgi:formylmethanofuran dehydrogenase subunit E
MITGCTFGKGNIARLDYGKWGLTLVEVASGKAVRVVPTAQAMAANKKTAFFTDYRQKGVPASRVPAEVVDPLVDRVLHAPAEQLLSVGPVTTRTVATRRPSFASLVCDACGEMVVEDYARVVGDRRVCIPCQAELTGRQR